MTLYNENYLLDKKVKIYQPDSGYKASSDAVWLAAAVAKVKKGDAVLDIGAGTGAVSLCLAERFKSCGINITGVELQPLLAEAANKSAAENGFDFVRFITGNIFETGLPPCSFAHVITNPPYSLKDMPSPNPSKAAAHNFQFNDLEKWIDICIRLLRPQGHFYMINRAEALDDILAAIHSRLGGIEIFPLYSKSGQKAKRVIVRAQKDSKTPLILHSGILVHNEDGSYSEKADNILRKGQAIQIY